MTQHNGHVCVFMYVGLKASCVCLFNVFLHLKQGRSLRFSTGEIKKKPL